jgi:hypothetical protein
MPDIAVAILSNRKDLYITSAVASLAKNVKGFSSVAVFDDSGDREWVRRTGATSIAAESVGYTEAMQRIWEFGRQHGGPVFFLEEDFTIDKPVDLADLHALLAANQSLMQVALQRQPWYEDEIEHGGVVAALEANPRWLGRLTHQKGYVEHDIVFTGNPSLIPARAFAHDWPYAPRSEQVFSRQLARKGFKFAYWGEAGHVTCTHHGSVTAGGGY